MNPKSNLLWCVLALAVTASALAQTTVSTVPNQKLIDGSYVSNPDKLLSVSTVAAIDRALKDLEATSTAQVAVVAVESIGDQDIFTFAQELFTTWGIGNRTTDNGLLILLVKDQRTIRIQTGQGLEGVLPDVVCKRIQREYMVPEFKNNDYDAGLLAGVEQIAKILNDPAYAAEIKASEENSISDWGAFMVFLGMFVAPPLIISYFLHAGDGRFADSRRRGHTDYPELLMRRRTWLIQYVGIPGIIVTLYGFGDSPDAITLSVLTLYLYYMATLAHRLLREKKVIRRLLAKEDYHGIVEFLREKQWYWFFRAVFFPIPFAAYFFYHLLRKRRYRNYPRRCRQCKSPMRKLSERREDEYLTGEQQFEEKIRTVDYDVWKCTSCESIEMWHYLSSQTKYTTCPKCKVIAWHTVSKRTITAPTYSSSGSGEVLSACKYCHHQTRSTYTIDQLTESSSSSSSFSSSSSSSDSGSWGGGSSGGGGASSSW